jgi:hypothetical protein
MPTRRISDAPSLPCASPDHDPPKHRVFPPGVYEHQCSACGHRTMFRVDRPYLQVALPFGPEVAFHRGDIPVMMGRIARTKEWEP